MLKNTLFVFVAILAISCSKSINRKVMLFYNGDANISQYKIVNKTNQLFSSKEFDISGFAYADQIEIDKDGKKYTIPIPKQTGYYVLNISTDTVYGSLKPSRPLVIDSANTAQAKALADSLQQLLEGKNISAANYNYRVLPNELILVSANVEGVRLFPPYKEMYGTVEGPADGSAPEIYKFNATEEVKFELANYRNIYEPVILKRKPAKK